MTSPILIDILVYGTLFQISMRISELRGINKVKNNIFTILFFSLKNPQNRYGSGHNKNQSNYSAKHRTA